MKECPTQAQRRPPRVHNEPRPSSAFRSEPASRPEGDGVHLESGRITVVRAIASAAGCLVSGTGRRRSCPPSSNLAWRLRAWRSGMSHSIGYFRKEFKYHGLEHSSRSN